MTDVAVYGKKQCVQCIQTKKQLDARGVTYTEFDVVENRLARELVETAAREMGVWPPNLPLVTVTNDNEVVDRWFGMKIDKIRGIEQ